MSVPDGLLVLLRDEPKHGYQLATDFATRTAGGWSLNTGQVYTTLDRLVRDGFVEADGAGDDTDGRRRRYRLTDRGRERADGWLAAMPAAAAPRDELVLRVLLTVSADVATGRAVIDIQRRQLVGRLQELRRAQRAAGDLVARMAADAAATRVESDLRWLDLCDERLRSAAAGSDGATPPPDAGPGTPSRPRVAQPAPVTRSDTGLSSPASGTRVPSPIPDASPAPGQPSASPDTTPEVPATEETRS
jgi:DNA-binding PadR family transcriptional regulator